jgi:hypothetical protein
MYNTQCEYNGIQVVLHERACQCVTGLTAYSGSNGSSDTLSGACTEQEYTTTLQG